MFQNPKDKKIESLCTGFSNDQNKFIEIMLDPETSKSMKRFQQDHLYITYNYDLLKQAYPDEWIAVYDNKIKDHHKDYWVLVAGLRDKYKNYSNFVIEKIETEPTKFALYHNNQDSLGIPDKP